MDFFGLLVQSGATELILISHLIGSADRERLLRAAWHRVALIFGWGWKNVGSRCGTLSELIETVKNPLGSLLFMAIYLASQSALCRPSKLTSTLLFISN